MAPGSTPGVFHDFTVLGHFPEPFCLGAEKWCKLDQLCVLYTYIIFVYAYQQILRLFLSKFAWAKVFWDTTAVNIIWSMTRHMQMCPTMMHWRYANKDSYFKPKSYLSCTHTHAELRLNNHAMSSLQMKSQASICSVHEGCLYFLNATFVYTREHIKIQSSASKLCCHVARSCVLLQRFSWIQWGSMRTFPWIQRHKGVDVALDPQWTPEHPTFSLGKSWTFLIFL